MTYELTVLVAGTGFAGQGHARDFVRDIQGEKVPSYPTFREGNRYQQIIDAIRQSNTWVDVSHLN